MRTLPIYTTHKRIDPKHKCLWCNNMVQSVHIRQPFSTIIYADYYVNDDTTACVDIIRDKINSIVRYNGDNLHGMQSEYKDGKLSYVALYDNDTLVINLLYEN